jgi:hypothetical protein
VALVVPKTARTYLGFKPTKDATQCFTTMPGFVTGRDLSRAKNDHKNTLGFSPCENMRRHLTTFVRAIPLAGTSLIFIS